MSISKVYDENEARKLGFFEDEDDSSTPVFCISCSGELNLYEKILGQCKCNDCEECA